MISFNLHNVSNIVTQRKVIDKTRRSDRIGEGCHPRASSNVCGAVYYVSDIDDEPPQGHAFGTVVYESIEVTLRLDWPSDPVKQAEVTGETRSRPVASRHGRASCW
jgi:hypothetical protein